jgi:hypothetical protein
VLQRSSGSVEISSSGENIRPNPKKARIVQCQTVLSHSGDAGVAKHRTRPRPRSRGRRGPAIQESNLPDLISATNDRHCTPDTVKCPAVRFFESRTAAWSPTRPTSTQSVS